MAMKLTEIRRMFRSISLRVGTDGSIYDKDNDKIKFGVLKPEGVESIMDGFVPIEEITDVGYTPINKELQLNPSKVIRGTEIVIDPQEYGEDFRKCPTTIAELYEIFYDIFPFASEMIYHDDLLEADMVDMAAFDRPEEGLKRINDGIQAIYYEWMERKLTELGYRGKFPSRQTRDDVLRIHMHDHHRNLFREWVESHEWDGTPRLRTWFQDTMGATAPVYSTKEMEDRYIGDVAEAWFIGGVKRMYSRTRHEIVPVFIGDQGVGKGQALKYTAGKDEWYKDTNVSIEKPDKFLESIKGHVVVELSESTQLRSKNSEVLKSFISEDADQYRKAYARHEDIYPRHFILAASSNLDNVFTDITGNRRYFPMYVKPSRAKRRFSVDRTVGQYDVEQVWAEALHMFKNGGLWYMSSESRRIAKEMQDYSTVENNNICVIDDYLDDPVNGYAEIGSRISREIIFKEVFDSDPAALDDKVNRAYRAWTNGQQNWAKIAKPVRIGGKTARGYERVLAPGEVREVETLKIVDGAQKKDENGDIESESPVELMRRIGRETGIVETGEIFPSEGISDEMLRRLEDEGYVYNLGLDGERDYRLGVMP